MTEPLMPYADIAIAIGLLATLALALWLAWRKLIRPDVERRSAMSEQERIDEFSDRIL